MSQYSIADASTIDAAWQKASASGAEGDCVELASYEGLIAIRDSKFPDGPAILCSRSQVTTLLAGVMGDAFNKE
ncbi:DUF397 domain-containing protein [Streptomyces acidiscabies]|uniref:DUF397 domain-containing protein n=1 Tax=Streptomyces acidiscabies TaxID=42234 RepID=A0AAP6B784_9ACTN|nr:DUF397 domain-containing protein [Streptomyces acidiscabies]MBP5939342.1 DUF397 domain-containing protein [Streptomyces sp. LBUM 1476]MBZ3910476.1 DUF397 domain-containing protein [Streptomyces acidiscabies]MDX2959474.1 DUF397 domain-containing protein [Streptomyces acidiscabies]MDX3019238.1 DUF397 domain-containing protein [Streptomyces acidiscabies]MDX3790681.1 DUF397 domain-containing protein [Streptomyces acidiscabies]